MPGLLRVFGRSILLRCPCCGRGRLSKYWFKSLSNCSQCGAVFEREPGFFLGAIFFSCAIATIAAAIVVVALTLWDLASRESALALGLGLGLGIPLLFFPWARSFWLGIDQFFDPRSEPSNLMDEQEPGMSSHKASRD